MHGLWISNPASKKIKPRRLSANKWKKKDKLQDKQENRQSTEAHLHQTLLPLHLHSHLRLHLGLKQSNNKWQRLLRRSARNIQKSQHFTMWKYSPYFHTLFWVLGITLTRPGESGASTEGGPVVSSVLEDPWVHRNPTQTSCDHEYYNRKE